MPGPLPTLRVDPRRTPLDGMTDVYVKAKQGDRWGSFDVATLERDSFIAWLRHSKDRAEKVALTLLGHDITTRREHHATGRTSNI